MTLLHMGNPKMTAVLIDGLDYRSFAHHQPGPRDQALYPQELNDYLFRFYLLFFVIVAAILFRLHRKNHHYTNSSSSTWQRSSSLSSRTHVAAFKHAHWGPKSPARVGRGLFVLCIAGLFMAYYTYNMSTWTPLTPPWWPEGSGSATRPSGADTLQALQTLSKAKPSGPGPQSIHLDGTQPHIQKTFSLRAQQWAKIHGSWCGQSKPISAAIHKHETPVYMAASLEAHQAQRDTMTARLHKDHGISYHLGIGAVSGHYCTAIQDGGTWRVLEDGLENRRGHPGLH